MTPVVVSSVAADDVAELLAPGGVEDADHVGAVVHRQLRLVVDRGLDVLVVGVVVLALDREDGDVVLVDERRGDVVLGRERVGRAEHDVRAAGLERAHQVRGLGGHVQAGGDAVAGERLLALRSARGSRRAPASAGRPTRSARTPSGASARSLTSCLFVVAMSVPFGSGGEQALLLPLFPFEVGRSGTARAGEPRLDRGSQVGLAPQPSGESDVGELHAEGAAKLVERPQDGSARGARTGDSPSPSAAARRGRFARDSAASAATSRSARPPVRR